VSRHVLQALISTKLNSNVQLACSKTVNNVAKIAVYTVRKASFTKHLLVNVFLKATQISNLKIQIVIVIVMTTLLLAPLLESIQVLAIQGTNQM